MSQYEPLYNSFDRSMHERYVPTARMSVSANVYLPGSEVDMYTGRLKPDHQRRCRTQGKRLEEERIAREQKRLQESVNREESKGGVRISILKGILLTAGLMFVCGMILLCQLGESSLRQETLRQLENKITDCQMVNRELSEQIAAASTEAVICYAASQNLGMVPGESITAIHLTAPDTRPALRTDTQPGEREVVVVALESQTTPVPVVASN